MNKQCQQPQAHPDRCGCVREIAEHNAQAYAEATASLAAKDARIAELESILRDALRCGFEGYNPGLGKTLREVAESAIASKQQAEPKKFVAPSVEWVREKSSQEAGHVISAGVPDREPATPSEDGGEVPVEYQQLSRYGNWDRIEKDVFDLGLIGATPERFRALYAAPVQHSRIVSAKDAEIARLKGRIPPSERLELWQLIDEALTGKVEPMLRGDICNILAPILVPLEAQPARQEAVIDLDALAWESIKEAANNSPWMPEQYMLNHWVADVCAFLREPARQVGGGERCPTCDGTGDVHGLDGEWKGECHCAALAPAAVAMPERLDECSDEVADARASGYNDALDRVARLNRNPIPVGLLRTALFGSEQEAARAANELRAMLGKDLE